MTASLNAILAKPHERSERAREVLAEQPMIAAHPLVSGSMPAFQPHRPPRPEKSEGGIAFKLVSEYEPKGDQPTAIAELVAGVEQHERDQVLLGVTGSGKTYTAAQVISRTQRPALVLAPNKTLAAQLYGEFKSFFPDNAVEYFVSYYDYYQPEAYVPRTDTYIEKELSVNEQIDRMRHAATRSLLERDDVIIVASVSCIYGIGSVETYTAMTFTVQTGESLAQRQLLADLVALHYSRSDGNFIRGTFRVRGDTVELFPAHFEDRAWRITLFGDEIESITEFDPLTGQKTAELKLIKVFANSHYVTPKPTLHQAIKSIKAELKQRLDELNGAGRLLEAQRLEQRTVFDIEMMEATGSCAGIENYSRYLTGRQPGEPPPTLFEYLPDNALVFVDESHVTVPQIGGMFRGDFRRKATLAEYGFRLPSCMDNRPLRFEEWDAMRPQTRLRLRHPRRLGDGADRRRLRRAGDPPHRPDRSAGRDPPRQDPGRRPPRRGAPGRRARATARWSPCSPSAWPRTSPSTCTSRASACATCTPTSTPWSASRSSATCGSAPSTCWSASISCARASTSPSARWSPSSTPTRKASCAARPASSRPSAAPPATSTARSSSTPTTSPARCSAPSPRPSAAARSRPPTTRPTASRPRASSATSTT